MTGRLGVLAGHVGWALRGLVLRDALADAAQCLLVQAAVFLIRDPNQSAIDIIRQPDAQGTLLLVPSRLTHPATILHHFMTLWCGAI